MALDEWGGRGPEHPLSCRHTIATALVEPVGLAPDRFHGLDGTAADPEAECRRYAALFTALGPPALALVGLGTNGHVGFNEPAVRLPAAVHKVALAPATMARAQEELGDERVTPYGLTLSLAQIMKAREMVLIASGSHKAAAVGGMFSGVLTTTCPASLLHLHPAVTVFLDEAAAALATD
jgi:glucosamine-6-phosphate deaminase